MAAFRIDKTIDILAGTYAERPSSGLQVGSRYYATDLGAWYLTSDDGSTWVNFTEPGAAVVRVGDLADDDSFLLPDATKGGVWFVVGDNEHWGIYTWGTDGTPTEVAKSSADVVVGNTDGKFCVRDVGTQLTLRNRLGAKKDLLVLRFAMP